MAKAPKKSRPAPQVPSHKLDPDLPNLVDAHVGNRLRVRRLLAGMTQDELAVAVGITFQQVQKYEKGANRISASRLWAFSNVLRVRVGWFFDEIGENPPAPPQEAQPALAGDTEMMETREALELIGAYWRISSLSKRHALLKLLREVSG